MPPTVRQLDATLQRMTTRGLPEHDATRIRESVRQWGPGTSQRIAPIMYHGRTLRDWWAMLATTRRTRPHEWRYSGFAPWGVETDALVQAGRAGAALRLGVDDAPSPEGVELTTPLDVLMDGVAFRCTCCGVAAPGGQRQTCACWSGGMDRCDRPDGFGCVAHCRCSRCVANRTDGYERVNWTGTRHVARVGCATTLCGRRIGGPPVWRAPMVRPSGVDECQRCMTRFAAAPVGNA